jgi:serine/threonine-protein kinase
MLTGRRLFDGETEAIVLARAIEGTVEPPSSHNAFLEPAVDAVVLRGLARDPELRYTTAREMALSIEQTIGLASPSEVGEWVESVAGDELLRRAQTISAIEVSALNQSSDALKIGMTRNPVSEPHSQVSSISVSRPAVSVTPPKRGSPKLMVGVFAVLAVLGGTLGTIAMKNVLAGPFRGEANRIETEPKRTIVMLAPPDAQSKANRELSINPVVMNASPPPVWHPPPSTPAKKPSKNCDPPYTIDAAGRHKYKPECY